MKQFLLSTLLCVIASITGLAQAPVNDICANAIPITVNGGYISCNNSNTVTNAANPSCGGTTAIKDIWYSFVYTGGTVVVETQLGTNTDTRIAVYTACGGTQIGCNDDYGGTYRSYLSFTCAQLTVGNTYYIQAGGYNATVGTFTLQVTASGILGCTDPQATNYLTCATQNDGTCSYPVLTAQFNYAPTGTNCLNIQYTSTSSGNITGYNWSFPGGTPSSSTAQNPIVTYPAAGTYSATLTVTDAAGSNTVTNNNVIITAGSTVTVDITPDANPTQTSWKMFDNNNVVIAQGTSNDATFCISSACHRFEIYDSAGNGLTGTGNYKVYLNGVLVAQGAQFGTRDIRYVNCPEGTSCNDPLTATLGLNEVPFDNSWYVFTPATNGQYRITTCGSAACDTRIWVYDYCVMANFDNTNEATYTYNDDFCGVQAQTDVFMTGGDTYYVRVGSSGACAGTSYDVSFEFMGAITGCMDILACNYQPLAGNPGPCYYNGDPNCSGLGPDLFMDQAQMYSSLTSTTITNGDACLVNEGCLQSNVGTRQILRFTTRIANIGTQDYFIGVPSAANSQFTFDPCHNHYHYAGYAEYLLFDANGALMPNIGFKNGFCVLDLSCPSGISAQYSCGNMGITAGCADIYSSSLTCQWIDITNVPAGTYYLVIRTNWDQDPDQNGRYELRYDNNYAQVCISFGRDASNNIINFTKNISSCAAIEDCLGIPFGDAQVDCAGNCPGTVLSGDVNNDGYLTPQDEHVYGEAAVNGGIAVSPCTDLNADGEITIADASYVGQCIHQQQDAGVPPLEYQPCGWDPEIQDPETVTVGLANLNTTNSTFDIVVSNPQNELWALQFDISGATISGVQNLLPTATWNAHLHFDGNTIAVTSEGNTKVPTYTAATAILRVTYSTLTGSTVCISNIVDILNDFNHNVLGTIGDCVGTSANVVANFNASATSVCQGSSVTFTNTSVGATTYNWSFPGGTPSTSTAANPTVTYNTPGTYNVTLTASNASFTDDEVRTGFITVGTSATWYQDADGDGYGNASNTVSACAAPAGYVGVSGDCNDNSAAVRPGATEVCNGIDDNCTGGIDEGFDADNDGYTTCQGDCNDNSAIVHPGAFEICNGADEDCDNTIDEGFDVDNDGYTSCGGDCNDNNAAIRPNAQESCNSTDDDCDGAVDEGFDADNDGFTSCGGDCNDNNSAIKPSATEVCNGIDDNCSGGIDEGFDVDGDGFTSCNGDCNDNNANINPEASELCANFVDDNCNGTINENCCNLNISGVTTNTTCAAISNGSINISMSNGTAPYTFVWSNGATTEDIANLAAGSYSVTVTDFYGCTASYSATISNGTGGAPANPTVINGPYGACRNSTGNVFWTPEIPGATSYQWTIPIGASGSSTTNSITLSFNSGYYSGSLSVRAVGPCGTSASFARTVYALTSAPAAPASISGPTADVCPNTTQTYTCAAVAAATSYQWTAPTNATITSGQGTQTVTISFAANFGTSGVVSVRAQSCAGTSTASRTLTVYSIPGTPGTITGQTTNVCPGSVLNYAITAVPGASSYLWTAPTNATITSGQGTASITLSIGSNFTSGTLSVRAVSTCGQSAVRSLGLSKNPAALSTMTGQTTNLCGGGQFTYSVTAASGIISYNWSVPTGCSIVFNNGNQILLNVPSTFTTGTLSVTALNSCGGSTVRSASLTRLPSTPASITGPASVCPNQVGVAFSTLAQGTNTFTWTVPAGCTIASGQGTTAMTANWGAAAGSVTVKANNACGSSGTRSKALTLATCIDDNQTDATRNTVIEVYPNPSNGQFTVRSEDAGEYFLINSVGQVVEVIKLNAANSFRYEVRGLSTGVYFLNGTSAGQTSSEKIVVTGN
ncbi:MAG: MopE-related protein [Flavobacteriales bacterium]|jgi:PKD repeat protein